MMVELKHVMIYAGIMLATLILVLGGIKYKDKVYDQGVQDGQAQVVNTVLQFATNCEQMPITQGNITINLLPLECLNQNCIKSECLK